MASGPADNPMQRWLEGVEDASERWANAESGVSLEQWRAAMTAHSGRLAGPYPHRRPSRTAARIRRYFATLWRALAGRED